MSGVEWWIAGRYLRSRRASRFVSLITLIAVSGVALGVMALIVVIGVMSGLQRDLREKILIANPHLRVLTYGEGLRMDSWPKVLATVRQDPNVVAAAPFVLSQGLLSAEHDYAEGVAVIGMERDTGRAAVTALARSFVSGDLRFAVGDTGVDGGVVLGRRLAQRFSVYPGSVVTLISPAGSKFNPAIGAYVPRYWRFEVTGIFETGMYEYDNTYLVMPRELAQRYAALGSAVTGIEVRVKDPWKAGAVARELETRLGYPYRALDWAAQNSQLFSALKLEKLAMAVILLLIVLVAAFNIVSTLTMTVGDRTKEIGILRAMGMTAGQIRRIFVTQGVVVGVVGTALGAIGGVLLAAAVGTYHLVSLDPTVYFIDHLPVDLAPTDVVAVIVASLAIAALATVYPSSQAARLEPVEAIRHE
ncbi:MAG TPA: lipoprotein-releasing ABC transporter permease subunit [Gemmatimonadales bacterium]|nr:lipoprotein-releasing ABC transporter permease subunit [Gemmatimonadales bacterium]